MSEAAFFLFSFIVFGLLVGSFLNVVISRMPPRIAWEWRKEARAYLDIEPDPLDAEPPGVVVKRSFCPLCSHKIAWYDNIPVVSYVLLLRGKCRGCQAPISFQYPAVEILTAALFALAFFTWGATVQGAMGAAFFAMLVALSGIDFKTQLLPDTITQPALWLALAWAYCPQSEMTLDQSFLGAALGYLSLWTVFWIFKIVRGKEGMGYGDFKLLAVIGAFLGAPALIWVILLASVLGSVVGIGLLVYKKGESVPFAFGPYLAMGAVAYVLFASHLPEIL